ISGCRANNSERTAFRISKTRRKKMRFSEQRCVHKDTPCLSREITPPSKYRRKSCFCLETIPQVFYGLIHTCICISILPVGTYLFDSPGKKVFKSEEKHHQNAPASFLPPGCPLDALCQLNFSYYAWRVRTRER